jgi:uncharacterized protein (DUF342 family)
MPLNGTITVKLDVDKMRAFVNIQKDETAPELTVEHLREELHKNWVVYGIDEEALETIVKSELANVDVQVAAGKSVKPGKNSSIKYLVEIPDGTVQIKEEKGKVDFRELGTFTNVTKGTVLATKIPSEPGEPGKDVFGHDVAPPKVRDFNLLHGRNVVLSEDKQKLIAGEDGVIRKREGRLEILAELNVTGDVDFSVGNIDAMGSIYIGGSVNPGFVVKSKGDITINKVVEQATIFSEGNIVIRGGVLGHNKTRIEAHGSVSAKFINSAEIVAGGDVLVSDSILHSNIIAGDRVVVHSTHGMICGGRVQAIHKIEAGEAGSDMGTKTELVVGIDPKLKKERTDIEERIKTSRENLQKLNQVIATLKEIRQKTGGKLPDDKEVLLNKSLQSYEAIQMSINNDNEELQKIDDAIKLLMKGRVTVRGDINPGVNIVIGRARRIINNTEKGLTFALEGPDIVIAPYSP